MLSCIYWFFALTGGIYIIFTFMVGELADFGHGLIDGIGNHIEGYLEGAIQGITGHFIDIDFGGHHVDVRNGPGPFSFRTLVMFATGFGAGGLLGYGLGLTDLFTLIPAFGSGIVMGVVAYLLLRYLYKAQGSTDISQNDYIGLKGVVITTIPENGLGQVGVTVKLHRKNVAAKSKDGSLIPHQTKVFITQAQEGGVFIVEKE
jgi:membrane protein implicated in regulation of membrane protease activity